MLLLHDFFKRGPVFPVLLLRGLFVPDHVLTIGSECQVTYSVGALGGGLPDPGLRRRWLVPNEQYGHNGEVAHSTWRHRSITLPAECQ